MGYTIFLIAAAYATLYAVGPIDLQSSTEDLMSKQLSRESNRGSPDISKIQQCAIDNLHHNLSFLHNARAITTDELIARRDRLAAALVDSRVDAFAVEPGYTFQYYGNISQHDWEPWEPEERPFLMIVQPVVDRATGDITARTSFLSPHFEEGRVRMLGIPAPDELEIVTWEEHWSPYDTLLRETFGNKPGVKIMVDEEMRDYIVRGLSASGFQTVGLSTNVEAVRQTKSAAEIELLRAVNTGTVEAVRHMRPCKWFSLTSSSLCRSNVDADQELRVLYLA